MIDQVSPRVHSAEERNADLAIFSDEEKAFIQRKIKEALEFEEKARALGLID